MATMDKSGTSVFEPGKHAVEDIEVDANDAAPAPPVPVLIVAPKDAGTYPVVMLLHGFLLRNHYYQHLLRHVASHGYITVAPQFSVSNSLLPPLGDGEDIAAAARVADWLPGGLPSVLPDGVDPELPRLALAGHSRGGHTAFALALGYGDTRLEVSFSALIGLDPVAGAGRNAQLPPEILTYEPSSFDTLTAGMPVLVVGTGLGEEGKGGLLPACAPAEVGRAEFYRKCRPPCYHVVARDYGHLDLLDDDAPALITGLVCESGDGPRDAMRRCVAGIMVAFLNAALGAEDGDLQAIVRDPAVSPAVLDPVDHRLQ
ncbi:hypothetical protein CFC21_056023 [Triticum aestivum]|uniref:Uncharacterized protein n=3 Tax=Triticum aestivum TaxID=4565 RepID=A0A3B6ILL9_WHEAT|nr:hypothetical protein CFC21_056023 [Triticum aestivum]